MKILIDYRLWQHPKLSRLAGLLKRNRAETGGLLVSLWSWTAEYRLDGSIAGQSAQEVATACGWRGKPDKLVSALMETKWLDGPPDALSVHDWEEHQGKFIRKMVKERERKRRARSADSPRADAPPGSGSVSGSGTGTGTGTGTGARAARADAPPLSPPDLGYSPSVKSGSPAALIASAYIRMNPGTIAPDKANKLVQFYLDRGANAGDSEAAVNDSSRCRGRKLWEVLEPLAPKVTGKPTLDDVVGDIKRELGSGSAEE